MQRINKVGFFVVSAIILFSIFFVPSFIDMPDLYLVDKNVISFTEGWTWSGDGYKSTYSLPYYFDVSKTEQLVIKNTIPKNIPDGANIALKSYMQSVVVNIDGEKVYEMGTDRDTFLGNDLGKFWVFIKLEPEQKGKEIEISLFSHREAVHGYGPEILISCKDALFAHNFFNTIWWNSLALSIAVSGILAVVAFFIAGMHKEKKYGLFYLGVHVFIMGNWFLGELGMLQLLSKNTYYVTRISPLMTLLAPVSVSLYIRETIPMKKRFLTDFITLLAIINTFVSITLEFLGISSLSEMLPIAIGFVGLVCVYYLVIFIIEAFIYKNNRALKELKALFVAFIGAVIEIILFYSTGQKGTSYLILLGVMVYLVTLVVYQVEDYGTRRKIREEREFFQKMAYTDGLTRADNRAKYIKDIEKIDDSEKVFIIQIDIDRLKYINDYFGHAAGDRSIIDTFEVLKRNFAGIGRVYRIGGDEYSVIVKNVKREEIDAIIKNVKQDVVSIDSERDYDFSVSIGAVEYNPELDESIYSASIRADHKMYDDKKRLRNSVPKKMPKTANFHR
ncbi:MAG: diguanylate cyclase [Treponema sp.]|nr:diguanylate cyclase [Treponema sp.]